MVEKLQSERDRTKGRHEHARVLLCVRIRVSS